MTGNNYPDGPSLTDNWGVVLTGTTHSEMYYQVEGHLAVDGPGEYPLWEERTQTWRELIPHDKTQINAGLVAVLGGLEAAYQLGFVNVSVVTDSMSVRDLLEEREPCSNRESYRLVQKFIDLKECFSEPTVVIWGPTQPP